MTRIRTRTRAAGVALFIAAIMMSFTACARIEGTGLVIDVASATCHVDAGTGYSVVQVPLRASDEISFEPKVIGVELDGSSNAVLLGIGAGSVNSSGSSPEALSVARIDEMIADSTPYIPVSSSTTTNLLILLKPRDAAGDATVESFTLLWGGGEPVYWQPLALSARSGDTCGVMPN